MAHYVITIAREKGSGGYDIAQKLSDRLNIPFYDRKLLRIASDVSGINERLFGEVDERLGKHEMMRAAQKVYTGEVLPPDSDNYTSQQNLFQFHKCRNKAVAYKEYHFVNLSFIVNVYRSIAFF